MKEFKKYIIRAAKYIALFLVLFLLVRMALCIFNVTFYLYSLQLWVGLVLLGLLYPVVGFNRIVVDLPPDGRETHEQKICDAIVISGYRVEKSGNNVFIFVATNKLHRVCTLYEDRITLQFLNATTISVSGPRKNIAHIQIQINDYLHCAKQS